jgi:hypothetical protein
MNSALLLRVFGRDQQWHGACTVIMDAEAAVATLGVDSILGGGAKQYAPRMISGRIEADAACLLADGSALLIVQQQKVKLNTGEESLKQRVTIADAAHVVAVEFHDTQCLGKLGVSMPVVRTSGSHQGIQHRPTVG